MMENKVQVISKDGSPYRNVWVALEVLENLSNPLQLLGSNEQIDLKKLPGNPTCFSLLDMAGADPSCFLNVQTTTKIPFFIDWNSKNKRLGEYPDQEYHQSVIYPWYQKAKITNKPLAHYVRARLCGRLVQYQRLIIPYKVTQLLLILYWVDFLVDMPATSSALLSPRERECLLLLAAGYGAKQIAQSLDLTPRTIEHYIDSAKQKLCAKNATHAVSMLLLQNMTAKDF